MKHLALVVALSVGTLGTQALATGSVPFRATIDTVVAPLGPCGATCLMINISGAGQGLHVGRTTIDGPSQIEFSTLDQSGISTMVAADGSTLTLAFSGQFIPGPAPDDATFFGTWEVLSGAGRFDGASGGGTYHGTASGPTGTLHIEGRLSNPGGQ